MIQFFQNLFRKKNSEPEEPKKSLEELRAEYQAHRSRIDSYLEADRKKEQDCVNRLYSLLKKRAKEVNSTCPICGSKNVIRQIKRLKGELDGKISGGGGYSTHYLFGGSSYHSPVDGSIHGELDTLEVNKCKDCGNEWNIEKAKIPDREDKFCDDLGAIGYLTRRLIKGFKLEYDPKDLSETAYSLEEKRQNFWNEVRDGWSGDCYRGVPLEVMEYAIGRYLIRRDFDEEALDFDHGKCTDPYLYRFSPKVRKVVEYITKEDLGNTKES